MVKYLTCTVGSFFMPKNCLIGESKRFISSVGACQLYINDTLKRQRERGIFMITNEKVKCYNCGEEISREEGYEYKDGFLCRDCYYEDFVTCADCGSLIKSEDAKVINPHLENKKYVCSDCADNYHRCSHCESLVSSDEVWASDSDLVICNHCDEFYYICDSCRCIVHEDDVYYSDGESYCHDCYDDLDSSYMQEYGYKPEPEFLGESKEGLYLGVELEVDNGCNLKSTTKRIYDDFADVYMKHDGSLSSSGFEIVSNPATLEYHMNELGWKKLMEICLDNDYRSHDTSTCGLHVHISRNFLGQCETEQELNTAKLIILFDRFWESHIIPFSRRSAETITRWADKPSVECMNTDTETEVMDKVKKYKSLGRYKAINLQNAETIEFRLFRGTLNFNTFLASLQFVVVISRFVKSIKLNDIFNTSWSDIFCSCEYQELKEYLIKKDLLKEEN